MIASENLDEQSSSAKPATNIDSTQADAVMPDMDLLEQKLVEALALHQSGQLDDAARLYRDVLRELPTQPNANHNLGVILLETKDFDTSLGLFKTALEAAPEDPQYWVSYVEALLEAGQHDYAGEVLAHGVEGGLQGDEVDALKRRLIEFKSADTTTPVSSVEKSPQKATVKAKKNGKPSFDEMNALVNAFNSGRIEESEERAVYMTQRYPNHGIGWKVLGAIRQQQGLMDDAFHAFKMAAEFLPNDSEAHYNLGNYYYDHNQFALAASCYQKAVRIDPGFAKAHYNLGSVLKDQGLLAEAEAAYRKALKLSPGNAQMHFNLGALLIEQSRFDEAEPSLLKTLELDPSFVDAYCSLSTVYQQAGLHEAAEASLRKAITINPNFATAHSNLANRLLAQGHLEEAEQSYINALAINPQLSGVHNNLGTLYKRQGKLDKAEASYRRAIEISPDYAGTHNNLGIVLKEQGRLEAAADAYKIALSLNPDSVEAHNNLGIVLKDQGLIKEAEAAYRSALALNPESVEALNNLGIALKDQGLLLDALSVFNQALKLRPNYAEANCNLGITYEALSNYAEAERCLRLAIAEIPEFAEAHSNLGIVFKDQGHVAEAIDNLLHAIQIKPDYYEAYSNLGSTYKDEGRLVEAEDCFRKALEIKPGYYPAFSNLLFCLTHNTETDAATLFAEHQGFGKRYEAPLKPYWPTHHNSKDPQRCLRVGIVSGDLRMHSMAYFIEPVLARLADYPTLSLVAYSTTLVYDDVSVRLNQYFKQWERVANLSANALAEKIYNDGIDILIDLSGHTAGHRLLTFAHKPSPIQASWLGYPGTTGLTGMDYYLADRYLLPTGELDDQFTEKLVQLPAGASFQPSELAPAVNTLPALKNGYITFGSFNRASKLSPQVISLWAQVLKALPTSRMLLGAMQQDGNNDSLLSWFANEGIAPDRLILYPRSNMADYLELHQQVDICLDTFPYNGGTTTWHAMWMGVPTLTLAGNMLPSRMGVAILGHVGLSDFVVYNKDDFVEKAVTWAGKLEALAELRLGMRERFSRSAVGRPELIAQGLESALRTMWQRWCQNLPAASFEVILPDQTNPSDDKTIADKSGKTSSTTLQIVSATRLSESDFWSHSALGLSLQKLVSDPRITASIAFENTRGLPEIFNECIAQADDEAILVFMHDDVWLTEPDFYGAVIAGLETYDVIGVAGNRRRLPNQPAWNFADIQFNWDSQANLSGRISHGEKADGKLLQFGAVPAECELLDGVFLAAKAGSLKQQVSFDPQFDFHFYDMDFCRSATQGGLSLGTWPISMTHQSEGAFGSQSWRKKYEAYLDKWDAASKHEVASYLQESVQKERELEQALDEVLQLALEHHREGEVELAQKLYLEIINIQPRHAEANHKLGLIEANLQSAEIAVPRLEIAVAEMPQNEQYWVSYIDALMQSGALESASGAIELGQKFCLSQDTAKMLSAEITQLQSANPAAGNIAIHVHQIYYSAETQQQNDPDFTPLDNLANPRPDWREYWPMRQYLLNNTLDEDAYYGFLSPKFKEKTNLSAADVYEFVSANASEADVFLFSPYFDQGAFSLNMFEQGESQHTDIKATFEGSVAKVAPQVDLATLVMDSRNIVFCNYIVAKPVFWKAWLAICEQLFAEAEENKTALAASLNAGTSHNNAEAPNKVFVIERIASLMLSTQQKNKLPAWRAKAYDSASLPFSIAPISHYPRELRQLDDLKIEGTPQALARYFNIRDSLQDRIQRPFEQELQQAVSEVLQMAKAQQSAGDPIQASQLYAEVIKIQPRHAEANYQLGVLEAHAKGLQAAVPRFELAVQAAPENEQYWVAYIDALVLSGAASSAIKALELGQQYGLKPETAELLKAEFAADIETGLKQEKQQAIAVQQSVLQALQIELKPSSKRPATSTANLTTAEPVIYVWAPDYSEFSSGVKCLHLLCDRLNQLGYEAYVTAENTNKKLNAPSLTDALKQHHTAQGRVQIAIYPEVEAGNPIGAPNVVRYLLNQPNKFFKTSWFGSFHQDEQVLHYDDTFAVPWVQSQGVRMQTVNRDVYKLPADTVERAGFLVYSHRVKPDLSIIPDWCQPLQLVSMDKPRLPEQLASLYQHAAGMIVFERTAAAIEAMLCGCPVMFCSQYGLEKSTVFYDGYNDFAWDFDQAEFQQSQQSLGKLADVYDANSVADTQSLKTAMHNIIARFREHQPDVLETTPAYALASAQQYAQQGDMQAAVLAYRQLMMNHPDYVEAYYRMAEALAKLGLAKPALQTLQQGEPYLAQLPQHACLDAIREMYMQKLAEIKAAV